MWINRCALLYLPYDRGGLRLANLQWYYWSAQLASVTYWLSLQPQLPWVEIESIAAKVWGWTCVCTWICIRI